jgi:hypothetical protein
VSTLRVSLASAFTVLRTAGRVLWDHWPVLLSLALVGQGLRLALIWAAVALSDHQSFLAQILLAMSPLAFLLPLIVMVIIAGSRLPRISTLREVKAPDDVTTHRERRLIDVMASVLAPFFGVYVGLGLFDDDLQYFKNSASVAEFDQVFTNQANFDPTDRIGLYAWWVVALLVVGAWVVRWLLARAERSKPWALLAVTGVLVEFYYTAQVANLLVVWKFDALSWITTRKLVADGFDGYESLMAQGSWFADPLRWAWDLISSFDSVIVVPVAWLLLGSIVLGHKLTPPTTPTVDRRENGPLGRLAQVSSPITDDVRERYSAFSNGLRMLTRGGFGAALLFCLAFVIATRLPALVPLASRAILGPMEYDSFIALAPYERSLGLALTSVVIAALLAAATEWLIRANETPTRPDPSTEVAAPAR